MSDAYLQKSKIGVPMGDYHFHYKREERIERGGRGAARGNAGGVFRRNRALTIVLLDIVILLIVMGVWWAFLRTPTDALNLGDYRFELSAGVNKGSTYTTLTVRNTGSDRSSALFTVEFTGEGGETIEDRDVLPIPGDVRVIRARWNNELDEVRMSVEWGEQFGEVRTSVR